MIIIAFRILNAIKNKNKDLSNNLKINVIKEVAQIQKLPTSTSIKNAKINSQEVCKNDIFFAIKGKKNDGNRFVSEAFKKKHRLQ